MVGRSVRGRGAHAAFLLALAGATASVNASAQPEAAVDAGRAAPRSIEVTIVGGNGESEALMETLRELLGRLGLVVVGRNVPEPPVPDPGSGLPPGASSMTVQIDLLSRFEVATTVRSPRGEFRRTIVRDASPSIVREEIGETIRSAIESQLLAEDAGPVPSPPAPPTASARVPLVPPAAHVAVPPSDVDEPPAALRGYAVDITTRAGGGLVAGGAGVVPRVGGGVVVASRRGLRPSLTVTGEYATSFETSSAGFGADAPAISSHAHVVSVRALPAIEVFHASWLAIEAGAGGGVDIFSVNPQPGGAASATPSVRLQSATRVDAIVTGAVTALVPLTPGVALTVVLSADVDPAPVHYQVLSASGQSQDGLAPWGVRPSALAGFTFTAFGGSLFAARGTL